MRREWDLVAKERGSRLEREARDHADRLFEKRAIFLVSNVAGVVILAFCLSTIAFSADDGIRTWAMNIVSGAAGGALVWNLKKDRPPEGGE